MPGPNIEKRLLFILHRGLVEIRLLAQAGKTEQIRDLADILEVMPGWLAEGSRVLPSPPEITAQLQRYEQKYPSSFNYSDFVDRYEPPPF
jgi:hypothetical protein